MWQQQLKQTLENSTANGLDISTEITFDHAIKYRDGRKECMAIDFIDYIKDFGRTIKEVSGKPWAHAPALDKDIRTNMLELFFKKASIKNSGMTGVTLAIYKTMLFNVNDEFIYWKGVNSLAEDSMFDRKTVYKHLQIMGKHKLIEFKDTGFHFHDNGWGKTSQIKLLP